MHQVNNQYYIPEPSFWPFIGCAGLFILFVGAAHWLHFVWYGPYLFFVGLSIILLMMFGWFARVINESHGGFFNQQVDRSFHRGMSWFIFSEALFFSAFFGAMFYTRFWGIPSLGGDLYPLTKILLWPDFIADWPLLDNPDNHLYRGANTAATPGGIPVVNTLLLLSSGATLTWAHWGLRTLRRKVLIVGLLLSIVLGLCFLGLQAFEYYQAYTVHQLTLNAGVYGSLFFLLTGFHGAHVTIGATMLTVIWVRSMLGHFTPDNHFAFLGVAWYWHFVDVVWLLLFILVYWL